MASIIFDRRDSEFLTEIENKYIPENRYGTEGNPEFKALADVLPAEDWHFRQAIHRARRHGDDQRMLHGPHLSRGPPLSGLLWSDEGVEAFRNGQPDLPNFGGSTIERDEDDSRISKINEASPLVSNGDSGHRRDPFANESAVGRSRSDQGDLPGRVLRDPHRAHE